MCKRFCFVLLTNRSLFCFVLYTLLSQDLTEDAIALQTGCLCRMSMHNKQAQRVCMVCGVTTVLLHEPYTLFVPVCYTYTSCMKSSRGFIDIIMTVYTPRSIWFPKVPHASVILMDGLNYRILYKTISIHLHL